MNGPTARQDLALEPDFRLGLLQVRPSACRVVHGETEIRLEALAMSVLVVLAQAAGGTVSRDELVSRCWQGRIVSDETISRTISKVRMLARGMNPAPFTLEVVPKVGYRLIPCGDSQAPNEPVVLPAAGRAPRRWMSGAMIAGSIVIAFLLGITFPRWQKTSAAQRPGPAHIYAPDIVNAILTLDDQRLSGYLRSGWKVTWPVASEGSTALHVVPLVCERNEAHDRDRLLKIAKLLVAAGADTSTRNKWEDTAYMISVSPRYCGPEHVVTEYLRSVTPGATASPVTAQLDLHTPK